MCGIAGVISFQNNANGEILQSMCNRLEKRGPDAMGYFIENQIALGHRRLSIIDLETGSQPMYSTDGNVVLVFNGEIYNFLELRTDLESKGIQFKSNSDTEVLLEGYCYYGLDILLEKVEGMFAFGLYDRRKETVFLVRDKFGEKPLYYLYDDKQFLFASELKALENEISNRQIDHNALNLFLSLSYIPAPYTIYKGVKKLPAAHYLLLKPNGEYTLHQYYNLLENIRKTPAITDFEVAKNTLKTLLYDSVEKRMVADVPLGSFLSGGIDSSIITAIMADLSPNPVNTFSIGFVEKEYDESDRAQLVADKLMTNHTVYFLDYSNVVDLIDEMILHFDEPFGDSSAIPSYYVAKLAREKVKVVLTGDCADELFGGYEKYLAGWYSQKFNKLPGLIKKIIRLSIGVVPHTRLTNSILRRAKKVIDHAAYSDFDLHYNYMCLGFNDSTRQQLLNPDYFKDTKEQIRAIYNDYSDGDILEKGFYTDLKFVLEGDMLVKVDRMCMKNSLEARVPFLDSRIVEAAYSMPSAFKIKGREKKYILKETFKNLLSKATTTFRKKGFGVPVDYWFKHQLKSDLETLLSQDFIQKQGIFNYNLIESLMREHFLGTENHKGKLWNLYVFQKWYTAKMQ